MIRSRQNRRLKHIRRLRRSKGGQALLDSPHLVVEAARLGLELDELLATPEFLADPARVALLGELPRTPTAVAEPLLRELVDVTTPPGILATTTLERPTDLDALHDSSERLIYVDRLRDPSNLGALARAAEAAAISGLVLRSGSVHPNHPRALRASAGSLLRLTVLVGVEPEELARSPVGRRADWLALVVTGGQALWRAEVGESWVLALGSEAGLSPEVESLATLRVTIPTAGSVESLNATQAATVTLFELARRRALP